MKFSFPLVAVSCLFAQGVQAQLFQDGFNYTAGSGLAGNGSWTGGNANITVGSGNLSYSGLNDLGGNDASVVSGVSAGSTVANFTGTAVTSGTIYYSFLIDCTALPTANNYVTSLLASGATSPNGSTDPLAFYVGQQSAGSTYKLGIRDGGSGATYATSPDFVLNTVNLVVVEYNFTGNVVSLFVDPTPGGSQPAANVSFAGANAVANLDEIGFKAQAAATTGNWLFDDVRVGTSWSDVTPTATPEPGTLALLGSGAVFGLVVRRFKNR